MITAPSGWQSIITVPAGVEEEEVFKIRVKNKPTRPMVYERPCNWRVNAAMYKDGIYKYAICR